MPISSTLYSVLPIRQITDSRVSDDPTSDVALSKDQGPAKARHLASAQLVGFCAFMQAH
jgi:hypothetical protein